VDDLGDENEISKDDHPLIVAEEIGEGQVEKEAEV
jgi:hypothetical protein